MNNYKDLFSIGLRCTKSILLPGLFFLLVVFQNLSAQCPMAPGAQVTGLSFGTVTENSIQLNPFSAPVGGADGYVIKVNTTNTFISPTNASGLPSANTTYSGSEQVVFAGMSNTGVTVTGLSANTIYYFKVYAYNLCSGTYTYETTGTEATKTTKQIPAITFVDIVKTYGDADFDLAATSSSTGAISYSIQGLANGTSLSGTNNMMVALGNAGMVIIRASVAPDENHVAGTKDITLTIGKAILIARAEDALRAYGDPNPPFTITYTGFKNNDQSDVIDTEPTASTIATPTTNAGTVAIVLTGGMDNNYDFILIDGVLTIVNDPTKVLCSDGSSSQEVTPQGGTRYQRQFYLITPEEMMQSALQIDSTINAIGFTIAAAQNIPTRGDFKVYLQNTTDTFSRLDTTWTTISTVSNNFEASGLVLGDYEWQVQTVCAAGSSPFTHLTQFVTADTTICNIPNNLAVDNITETSSVLNWTAPRSSGFLEYQIRYSTTPAENWDTVYSNSASLMLTDLMPNTQYQVWVQTTCSGDASSESVTFFNTLNASLCNTPNALNVGTVSDMTAVLSWDPASGANYYSIEYRRSGTSNWISLITFSDSITIAGLSSGTPYEWRIKTICSSGTGAFVAGTPFMTTGLTICYPPENLQVNVIDDTSAMLSWASNPGAISYNLRYRLKNSISWTNAIQDMDLVHHDSITIPDQIGKFRIPFKGMGIDNLKYEGNGLYVAWEYSRSTGELSTNHIALATSINYNVEDKNGQDSIFFVLSLRTRNDIAATSHQDILLASGLRPETWLGSAGLQDSVEVAAVYGLGHYALPYINTDPISALIINHSDLTRTYPVTLSVFARNTGALRYTAMKNVMIEGDTSALVNFTDWIPSIAGIDSIVVSVPAQGTENVLGNNHNFYLQQVNNATLAYDDGSAALTNTGFGTTSGLVLARHRIDACGSVNAAQVYLDYSAKDKEVYAVLMDESGTLIDSSDVFTPDSTEVNKYHSFYFPEAPFFNGGDFYIGLAQKADGMPYFPVGVQWETTNIRDSAYYRANIDGTGLLNHPYPGRLMIRAELIPGKTEPILNGNLSLCAEATDILGVGSKISRFANRVLDVSSQFSNVEFSALQALGAPNIYPDHSLSGKQWISETADNHREFIVLGYSNPGRINFIDIYQTLNPGAIDTVYVKNPGTGNFDIVYMDTAKAEGPVAAIKHISFDTTAYDVSEIRIALASDVIMGPNGIDAVAIGLESDTSTFVNYAWSNSESTQSILISNAGTYSVTVTDDFGCQSYDSIVVVTPTQIAPIISVVSGLSTTFCQGDSITLKSDKTFGNTWSTTETTDSIVVYSGANYFVSFDDGTGCGTQLSNIIMVNVDTIPIPVISGSLGFCPGGMTILDAGAGYDGYHWSNDSAFQTIHVTTPENFQVTVTDGNGCTGTSMEISTFNTPPITPSITGDLSVCPGDSTILDVGSYSTYLWSTGSITQTIFAKASETVFVTVSDSDGCIGTTNVSTFIAPPLSPVISGDLSFCPGDSTMLDVGVYDSYLWSTGESTRTIFVAESETVFVTVTDTHGCSGAANFTTSIYSPPSPNITGDFTFCPGDSTMLSAGTFITYEWSTGAVTQTIFASSPGTFKLTVTDANGCLDSTNVTTSQFSVPLPAVSGNLGFCPGGSTTLMAESGFISYLWSTGANLQQVNVDLPAEYTVTVTDGNGCKGNKSVTVVEYSDPEPFISGTLSFCGGSSTQLNAGGGFIAYQWSTGETSQAIFVENPDTYRVSVTDEKGCIGDTSVTVFEDGSVPSTPGPIAGPTVVTGNPELIQYAIDPVPNTAFYVWTLPEGLTVIGAGDSTTIVIRIDSFTTGEILVEAANACGLSPSVNPSTINFEAPTFGDCNQVGYVIDNTPIPSGIYLGSTINSAGSVATNSYVLFKSASTVNLNIGFNAALGAVFEIQIINCEE